MSTSTRLDFQAGDRTLFPATETDRAALTPNRADDPLRRVIVRLASPDVIHADTWRATTDLRTGLAVQVRSADCGGGCRCAAEVRIATPEGWPRDRTRGLARRAKWVYCSTHQPDATPAPTRGGPPMNFYDGFAMTQAEYLASKNAADTRAMHAAFRAQRVADAEYEAHLQELRLARAAAAQEG